MKPDQPNQPVGGNAASPSDPLVVREHARQQCRIEATAAISPDSPTRLTLARTIGDGTGGFACWIVDFSDGGVGVESPVFLPRDAALQLSVKPSAERPGSEKLSLTGTIRRSAMISRTPAYYLGVAFDQPTTSSIQSLQKLANLAGAAAHTTETTIARA